MSSNVPIRVLARAGPRWVGLAIVRSEALKLWSLRPPRAVVLVMLTVPVALAVVRVLPVPMFVDSSSVRDGSAVLFESIAVGALPLAFLAALLGIISVTSEYTDDVLAGSVAAVPRRLFLLAGKAVPAVALAAGTAFVGSFAAAWIVSLTLVSRGYSGAGLDSVWGLVASSSAGSGLFAVLGLAAGAFARSSISATLIFTGAIFLAPRVFVLAGGDAGAQFAGWLPVSALQALTTRAPAQPIVLAGSPASTHDPVLGFFALLLAATLALSMAVLVFSFRRVHRVVVISRSSRKARRSRRNGHPALGLTFSGVVRSEVLKALTMPSVRWLLVLTWVANIWLACQVAIGSTPDQHFEQAMVPGDLELATFDEQSRAIGAGIALSHLLIAGVGAAIMTSDFSSGNIRPALVAVPNRGGLVIAKTGVAVTVSMLIGLTSFMIAALIVTELQRSQGYLSTLDAPIVFLAIAKGTVVLGLIAAIGSGLGALLRSSATTLLSLALILVVLPSLLTWLQRPTAGTPLVWFANLSQIFPDAVEAVSTPSPNSQSWLFADGNIMQFNSDQDMLILIAWAIAILLVGWATFRRRGV